MKKLILISTTLFCFNLLAEDITEEMAIEKLENFFYLLDVDRYERDDFSKAVTNDFQIFEDGLDLDLESFHQFVTDATGGIIDTEWKLSNFKVILNENSAHISYYNNGVFKLDTNESINSFWMESVYMILEEGELKVQFLQSDLVDREIK